MTSRRLRGLPAIATGEPLHSYIRRHLDAAGSPVTRNRNMALNAFRQWPAESWPPQARRLIEGAAATDPNDHTRELAGQVLRGESPEDA